MKILESLSFDDVLLVPVYSDIRSRLDVDVSTDVGGIKLKIPIISSAMDTVTEWQMAATIGKLGGMGIIHRFLSHDEHKNQLSLLIEERNKFGKFFPVVVAVGVKEAEQKRLKFLMDHFGSEIDMISLDIANGHSVLMKEMIQYVRENYGNVPIMAGNVATAEGYNYLAQCGANAVRVGIGSGCLHPDMRVLTSEGYVPIKDMKIGMNVLTHTGTYKPVSDVIVSKKSETLYKINGLVVTGNHKFYVVNKVYKNIVNNNNLHQYAEWVEAQNLNDNFFCVELEAMFVLKNIEIKELDHYLGDVYDITVKDDHSFVAENIVVHNSICKTRTQTSSGVTLLQSLFWINEFILSHQSSQAHPAPKKCSIIADGGIRYPKDLVASLAAGADAVMVGGIFAGTNETPGEKITIDGEQYKLYRGMASSSVQNDRGGGLKPGTCAEGVTTHIKAKGPISEVIDDFVGGLRSGMSYQNARTVAELKENPQWIRLTNAGLEESHAYGTKTKK